MWGLIRSNNIRENIFGTNKKDARIFLLKMAGTIFTGFVLMITILWGLAAQGTELHPFIIYIKSFSLVAKSLNDIQMQMKCEYERQ